MDGGSFAKQALQLDEASCSATVPPSRPRRRMGVKIIAAGIVLGVGCTAIISNNAHVVSDNAVVSSYTTSLRAPISGYVAGLQAKVGDMVVGGSVFARLSEPRVDNRHLTELGSQLRKFIADREAREHERDRLKQQFDALLDRAKQYDRAAVQFTSLQVVEAEHQSEAKGFTRDYFRRDYDRKNALGKNGNASVADVEKAWSIAEQYSADTLADILRIAYLRIEAQAARDGVLLNGGSNDVSYSQQRADEIAIRLTEVDRDIATLATAAAETRIQLEAEQRRISALQAADLIAPSSGMLWRLGATFGERIGVGDTVAELVDCKQVFVVDVIPQENYPDVALGSSARVRLAGESTDRIGHVVSVTGDVNSTNQHNLAAVPPLPHSSTVVAWIALNPTHEATSECLVGRTARVILPVAAEKGPVQAIHRLLANTPIGGLLGRI